MSICPAPICNEDCLHCIYPDCILDTLTDVAVTESGYIERELLFPPTSAKRHKAAVWRSYYERNREQLLAAYKEWRDKNADYFKAYRETHREEAKQTWKTYATANRKKLRQKYRDYYAAHKEELQPQKLARANAYYKAHREELQPQNRARAKAHYEAHREEILAKKRAAYAARKKQALQQPPEGGIMEVQNETEQQD